MRDWRKAIDAQVEAAAPELRRWRRYLHAHPELSGAEYATTRFVAEKLEAAGIAFRIPDSERGLIADSLAARGGRKVALRADLDALPLHDEKNVPYRSTHAGITHACGHDAHTTMLLGAILALHACRDALPWPTGWRGIFQPAEEIARGAQEMVEAGAVEGVDCAVALHVDPERAVGTVGVRKGCLTAASEELHVAIRGEGGHGARPHHTSDPIAIATQFVNALYQLVPRSVDSRDPVVVSFGMIAGGANANVIPELVQLKGTVRTLLDSTQQKVKERILAIARGLAEAGGVEIDVRFVPGTAAVVNDPGVTEVCATAAREIVGAASVQAIALPSMGAEDFSAYLTHIPGCLLRLGVAGSGEQHFLHSPLFDIDEEALLIGAKLLAYSAVLLCDPGWTPLSETAG